MKSDIEIANEIRLRSYHELAEEMGIDPSDVIPYTNHMAKLPLILLRPDREQRSKLVLVTSISPTKAGIGKTTTSIGLAMGLRKIGVKAMPVLREPSLGPCFGMKGGACGGGYAQLLPMDRINLHLTGDFHAVTTANNLIAAEIDNHMYRNRLGSGAELLMDVAWRRVMDMNDRSLRSIVTCLGEGNGLPKETGFDITPASEIMAVLCLARDEDDLRRRIDSLIVGFGKGNMPCRCRRLGLTGSVMALLKDAIMPNLVQMTDGGPALVHGGPFANIAHGCNSVVATRMGLGYADVVVTEAGFGSDLGAEKFYDIKCRQSGLVPDLTVVALTVEGLARCGGGYDGEGDRVAAVNKGLSNLRHHIINVRGFGQRVLAAVNRRAEDTDAEILIIRKCCESLGAECVVNESYAKGAEGAVEFAETVRRLLDDGVRMPLVHPYELEDSVEDKIAKVCSKVYGVHNVEYAPEARNMLRLLSTSTYENFTRMPVCIAKTQYSFTDDPKVVGEPPRDAKITVRDIILNGGAEFLVAVAGDIMRMPGLPRDPASRRIDVRDGVITGLS